jgi:hypothetical protein
MVEGSLKTQGQLQRADQQVGFHVGLPVGALGSFKRKRSGNQE